MFVFISPTTPPEPTSLSKVSPVTLVWIGIVFKVIVPEALADWTWSTVKFPLTEAVVIVPEVSVKNWILFAIFFWDKKKYFGWL